MGTTTAISWTDHTFNPWWGCTKVSPACDNCYAERDAHRYGHNVWGKDTDRRRLSDQNWAKPIKWNRDAQAAGRPALVFCASMADVFEQRIPDDLATERARLFRLIEQTPHLIWQLLTKRPEWVPRMVPMTWLAEWPANVWIGTTVEDAQRARLRIPRLARVPAHTRFLSAEPLLEPLAERTALLELLVDVDWMIVGGESGPGHRPFDVQAARDLRDACSFLGIPFFFKQVGGFRPSAGGDELDGVTIKQFPVEAGR